MGIFEGYGEEDEAREPTLYSVAPYLIDQVYGGPEEGGWYYTAGNFVSGPDIPLPVFVRTYDEAVIELEKMNVLLAPLNEGRADIHSVLSNGRYQAEIQEGGSVPQYFPIERPYYE